MMKWHYLLSALLLNPALHAWDETVSDELVSKAEAPLKTSAQMPPSTYPYKPDQKWQITESYLYWKPFQADIDYGARSSRVLNVPNDITREANHKVRTKKPRFEWGSGVRLALAKALPDHDNWDVDFVGTYFYGQGWDKNSPNVDNLELFSALFSPVKTVLDRNKLHLQINYFTFDLSVGRFFLMTPVVTFHPYIGIRGAIIDQDLTTKHDLGLITDDTNTNSFRERIHIDNDFWGIGPRLGVDFTYNMSHHWNLLGDISAALFYGQTKVREKIKGENDFRDTSDPVLDAVTPFLFKVRDKEHVIRSNVETSLGIGWETWVQDGTVRIAPSVLFEGSMWFSLTHLPKLSSNFQSGSFGSDNIPVLPTVRRHGHLAFMGVTFNFEVDF